MKALRKFKDKCIYSDWEGGFITGEHRFDKDGYCVICGSYIYDIKIITSSGSELTIVNGTFTILSGVTLRDS